MATNKELYTESEVACEKYDHIVFWKEWKMLEL